MEEMMFCPLLKRWCLKEKCVFYIEGADDCTLNCIMYELSSIAHTLRELKNESKTQNKAQNRYYYLD